MLRIYVLLYQADEGQKSEEGNLLKAVERSFWITFIDQLVEISQEYEPFDHAFIFKKLLGLGVLFHQRGENETALAGQVYVLILTDDFVESIVNSSALLDEVLPILVRALDEGTKKFQDVEDHVLRVDRWLMFCRHVADSFVE